MPRPPKVTRHDLERLLIRAGAPVSATDLSASLTVNRTTVVRCLADFGDDDLITLGATRSTRYALRRSIPGAGSSWPIYRLDETGRASEWARP